MFSRILCRPTRRRLATCFGKFSRSPSLWESRAPGEESAQQFCLALMQFTAKTALPGRYRVRPSRNGRVTLRFKSSDNIEPFSPGQPCTRNSLIRLQRLRRIRRWQRLHCVSQHARPVAGSGSDFGHVAQPRRRGSRLHSDQQVTNVLLWQRLRIRSQWFPHAFAGVGCGAGQVRRDSRDSGTWRIAGRISRRAGESSGSVTDSTAGTRLRVARTVVRTSNQFDTFQP